MKGGAESPTLSVSGAGSRPPTRRREDMLARSALYLATIRETLDGSNDPVLRPAVKFNSELAVMRDRDSVMALGRPITDFFFVESNFPIRS